MRRRWSTLPLLVLLACAPALTVRRAAAGRFSVLLPSRVATPVFGDAVAGAAVAVALQRTFDALGPPMLDWVAVCNDLRPCGPVDVSVRVAVLAAPLTQAPPDAQGRVWLTQGLSVRVEVLHSYSGRVTATHDYQDQERGDAAVLEAPSLLDRLARRVAQRLVRDLQPEASPEKLPLASGRALEPANTLAADGKLAEARAAYEALLATQEDAATLHNLGVVLEVQGETEQAKARLQRAVALAPQEPLYQQALDTLTLREEEQARAAPPPR